MDMDTKNRLTKADLEVIKTAHPFSRSLGDGPYRFVGMFSINLEAGRLGRPYINPYDMHPNFISGAGTCAHCGMAILNVYQVQCANGEVYGVGSDCITKLDIPHRELTAVEKAKRDSDKAKRAALKTRKGAEARGELVEMNQFDGERMANLKHPFGTPGRSLLDYATWILERSNDGGVVIALKRIQAAIATAQEIDTG